MAVSYKDIDSLSKKTAVAGTEKIPVSDTEYITPEQISNGSLSLSGGTMTGAIAPAASQQNQNWAAAIVTAKQLRFPNTPNQASLSTEGWYRVWAGGVTMDSQGCSVLMHISKTYSSSGGSEAYTISVEIARGGAIKFTQLSGSVSALQLVTKVRVVYTTQTSNSLFIDLYYAGSASGNGVNVYGLAGKAGIFQAPAATNATVANSVEFSLSGNGFKTSGDAVIEGDLTVNGSHVPKITISENEPTADDGDDGDIWIVI